MGKESIQSAVAAEHGRDAAQLKAEHGKEMSALKAEEAQALAAQKAEHSKTPGKTGLIAKLTGKEDPVKKAEKQQLKAEIARAEETTKAAHDHENAELKAHGSKHMASVNAMDNLHGSSGSHNLAALPAGGLAHSSATDGHVLAAGIPDKKIYNHATGAHGQAALADNGVHHHNHHHGIAAFADNGLGDRHHHHDNNQGGLNQGGLNQGGFNQGGMNQAGFNQGGLAQAPMVAGAIPVAVMPMAQSAMPMAQPAVAMAAAPLATHGAPLMATHGAPLATHGAPLAAHGAPLAASHMSSGGAEPVAVIAPSHSNRL